MPQYIGKSLNSVAVEYTLLTQAVKVWAQNRTYLDIYSSIRFAGEGLHCTVRNRLTLLFHQTIFDQKQHDCRRPSALLN
jgi:hypothetical protein